MINSKLALLGGFLAMLLVGKGADKLLDKYFDIHPMWYVTIGIVFAFLVIPRLFKR